MTQAQKGPLMLPTDIAIAIAIAIVIAIAMTILFGRKGSKVVFLVNMDRLYPRGQLFRRCIPHLLSFQKSEQGVSLLDLYNEALEIFFCHNQNEDCCIFLSVVWL